MFIDPGPYAGSSVMSVTLQTVTFVVIIAHRFQGHCAGFLFI